MCVMQRLVCVTLSWAETDDSVLIYISTNTPTSPFEQNRKNNSQCVKFKSPYSVSYLLKEPKMVILHLKFTLNHTSPLMSLL